MAKSNKTKLIYWGAIPLLAVGTLTAVTSSYLESSGFTFFNNGKEIKETLESLGRALKAGDKAGIEKFFASDYQGSALGLNGLKETESKDGIHKLVLTSGGKSLDHAGALAEWLTYLDSFEQIDEVNVHIHRFDDWKSRDNTTARIRFELIGRPRGAKYAGIDRAFFKMSFRPMGGGLQISSASLLEGDRSIGDAPHFVNVAEEAGVGFKNQYFPEFLKTKLPFAMIRYGPAGISTADYDNDGNYDLFIPDGVESKLFHNTADGHFEDVTAKAGLAGLDGVSVGVFGDYDNDGYKDLFVSRTFKPNQLFHNNHDGTFTDVTKKSGLAEDCCTTVAAWADYDNDGFLDLYVGRYLDPRLEIPTTFYARNGLPNQLYHNNGDGTFTNVTEKAGDRKSVV